MKDRTRVAFFADVLIRDLDGANRTIFQIIDRMDRNNFEYLFVCGFSDCSIENHEVFLTPSLAFPMNNTYRISSPLRSSKVLKRLEAFKPHVIHITTPSPLGFLALNFGSRHRIPVLSIYHTHFISYTEYYTKNIPVITGVVRNLIIRASRRFYSRCSEVLVPTPSLRSELSEYGFRTDHLSLWARGIDNEMFSPHKRDEGLLIDLTGNTKANILFVSRLVWEKNLKVLIGIYEIIQKYNKPYNIIVVGDGVARDELKRLMPMAFFLGEKSHHELANYYASADVFVFPSVSESFGNVVVEAMASGLPCIAANCASNGFLIDHSNTGLLVLPHSPNAYLDALELLERVPGMRDRIVSNGLAFAKKLNWDSLVAEYFYKVSELKRKFKNISKWKNVSTNSEAFV